MKRTGFVVGLTFALTGNLWACCGVGPRSQDINFGDQTNIIIWDAAEKTQHFIRVASFDSESKSMGFLAPTPSIPELEEVDRGAMDTLERLRPVIPNTDGAFATAEAGVPKSGVAVVQDVNVGQYRAVTFQASDGKALAKFMTTYGFVAPEDVTRWMRFYTRKNWLITAFLVRKDANLTLATGAIRMSFKTEAPFNPFYIPKSNLGGDGYLRLYVLSDSQVDIAPEGPDEEKIEAEWTTALPPESRLKLAKQLKLDLGKIPVGMVVSAFEPIAFTGSFEKDLVMIEKSESKVAALLPFGLAFLGLAGLAGMIARRRQQSRE